jgi:hypothetical protein
LPPERLAFPDHAWVVIGSWLGMVTPEEQQ